MKATTLSFIRKRKRWGALLILGMTTVSACRTPAAGDNGATAKSSAETPPAWPDGFPIRLFECSTLEGLNARVSVTQNRNGQFGLIVAPNVTGGTSERFDGLAASEADETAITYRAQGHEGLVLRIERPRDLNYERVTGKLAGYPVAGSAITLTCTDEVHMLIADPQRDSGPGDLLTDCKTVEGSNVTVRLDKLRGRAVSMSVMPLLDSQSLRPWRGIATLLRDDAGAAVVASETGKPRLVIRKQRLSSLDEREYGATLESYVDRPIQLRCGAVP